MANKTNDSFRALTKAQQAVAAWRVSLRTAQKWCAAGVPVDDEAAMIRWVAAMPSASRAKLTRSFLARIDELRLARERAGGLVADRDYADFLASPAATSPTTADNATLADLKRNRDFAVFKLRRCQERGDTAGVKDATENIRYIAGVIHDEELRAQRLNRELGDTISRAEAERAAAAMGFWLVRGADAVLTAVCARIAAASAAPLFPEEVRRILEPALLEHGVGRVLARAVEPDSAARLPAWFVAAFQTAAAGVVEPAG